MKRLFAILISSVLVLLIAVATLAQQTPPKGLEGTWKGTIQSQQGERDATATFKKEKDAYTGTITGRQGDLALLDIKITGDKVTARAEVETSEGTVGITYSFVLKDDTLNGSGEVNIEGQTFGFDIKLKRVIEKK